MKRYWTILVLVVLVGCVGCAKVREGKLSTYVETAVVSDWVVPSGFRAAGASSQNTLVLSKGPVSGFVWYSHALEGGEDSGKEELDVGISYTHSLTENLSLTAQAMVWTYPNNVLGGHSDYLAGLCLAYTGLVDVKLGGLHMVRYDGIPAGESFCGTISKTFSLYEGEDWNVSVTPCLSASYVRNFYGASDGFKQITPGVSLNIGKGPFVFTGFVKQQYSLDKDCDEFLYGGASVGLCW